MIEFVNAKINLGLNIVGKREDGYHLLETIFYPIGLYNGRPENPDRFNDMLEITTGDDLDGVEDPELSGVWYDFTGNPVDCPLDKHLVVKAVRAMMEAFDLQAGENGIFMNRVGKIVVRLYKQLPDGAGMGGGSADATFTLRMLNAIGKEGGLKGFSDEELEEIAVRLGADCAVFVKNRPAYAEGIGEELEELPEILAGKWALVVKPDLHISTREAFAGVTPRKPEVSMKDIIKMPISEWKGVLKNDFEDSLFPKYPVLPELKGALYAAGAEYASMTGSGAALYGIFPTEADARKAEREIRADFKVVCKL